MSATPLTESYWPADPDGELLDVSLGDLLRTVAAEIPDRTALVFGTDVPTERRRWTYEELLAECERAAYALAARFEPGERVALWAPNIPEFEFLQFGAALAGIPLVLVNPALKADEVSYILRQSRAAALVLDDRHLDGGLRTIADTVVPQIPGIRQTLYFSEWDEFLAGGDPSKPLPTVDPGSPAQIQYTSGTTGFPKGAVLHHRGLVTNANLCNLRSGAELGWVFVNPLPMFHVGSCTLSVIGAIVRRGTHVLIPRFDPTLTLELIEAERGNIIVLVPTVLNMILAHPDLKTRDLSSLRTVFSGGANVAASLIDRVKNQLSCSFTNGFGQTEAHGTAIQTRLEDTPEDQGSSVGRALPLTEVKIADSGSKAVVPIGDLGEVCIRGYQSMIEYFDMPDESAVALDEDGWLHTGDLGRMDDRGFVRVESRIKDMIIRGGENVYPAEVENALVDHPAVGQAQVIGIPDELWGEMVAAVVQRSADGVACEPAELYAHCRARLASYKAPRLWYFVDQFPMTASGKIKKFALREQIQDGSLEAEWQTT